MTRILLIAGVAVIAIGLLAVGLLFYTFSSLDEALHEGLETTGSDIAGATVAVEKVDVDIIGGVVRIHGLTVANPEGFSDADAIRASAVGLSVLPAPGESNTVRVRTMRVAGLTVAYETHDTASGKSNLDVLLDNAARYKAPTGDGMGGSPSSGMPPPTFRVLVESLSVDRGTLRIVEGDRVRTAALPAFHLDGIGAHDSGTRPAALFRTILETVIRKVEATLDTAESE